MNQPNAYFTCRLPDGTELEDCYLKNVMGWVRGGRGKVKILPWLKSTELMYQDKPYKNIGMEDIVILDTYIYENGNRISVPIVFTKHISVEEYED